MGINYNTFSQKRVLITGGLGFIGSNLARKLLEYGAHITLVDSLIPEYGGNLHNISDIKDKVNVNIADVRDEYSMQYLVRGFDYLFNLAGQTSHQDSMTNPFADLDINAKAQLSILEACRKNNPHIKIVFASTRQIYGKPNYLPVDETHVLNPVDVNGINKIAGEFYHLLYNNVYGIKACALRLTNTYGPGMRVKDARQTFVGIWIKNALESKPILIFGDGLQKRDFTYIDDVINALLLAALSDDINGKALNLGGLEIVNLVELAEIFKKIVPGLKYEIVPFPPERKAIDIGDYYSDDAVFKRLTHWQPEIDLLSGLSKSISYYKENAINYF